MTYYLINSDIIFDNASGKVVHVNQKETRQLKSNEWKLLHLFVTHPGTDISVDHILNAIWDGKRAKSSVATSIKNLRQLLGDSAETPRYIQTQVMKGYALIAAVTPLDEAQFNSKLRQQRSLIAKAYQWCIKRPLSFALYLLNLFCIISLSLSLNTSFQHGVFDDLLPSPDKPTEWLPMVIKGSLGQEIHNYNACQTLLSNNIEAKTLNRLDVSPSHPAQKLPALTWADANKKVLLCHLSLTE